jgi:hypothetical protein
LAFQRVGGCGGFDSGVVGARLGDLGIESAEDWPAGGNVDDVDCGADFADVPSEVFGAVGVGEVVLAVEDGCYYL